MKKNNWNDYLNEAKNDFILIIISSFIMYNVINILGKQFLSEDYYINGQPTYKTFYILLFINIILSTYIAFNVKKYINIPKLKINIYLKHLLFIVFSITIFKCHTIYLKKTDNVIYYKNKFNNWLFSNSFYIKYKSIL